MSSSTDIALINAICILEDNEKKLNLITKLKSCQLQLSTERGCIEHVTLFYSLACLCCDDLSFFRILMLYVTKKINLFPGEDTFFTRLIIKFS